MSQCNRYSSSSGSHERWPGWIRSLLFSSSGLILLGYGTAVADGTVKQRSAESHDRMLVEYRTLESLIQQLGSSAFAEREVAHEAIDRLGVHAIDALKSAAASNDDLEICARAKQLLSSIQKRVRKCDATAIRDSALSSCEKGRFLRSFLKAGMTMTEVRELMGSPAALLGTVSSRIADYSCYGLVVCYDTWNVTVDIQLLNDE